jgi:hypothetical protein
MSEIGKTLSFGGAAVVLALLALLTAPARSTPDAFLDRGDPFFPDFTNPNEATTLEVIDFDEETAEGRPFKVTNQDGLWTIPSHNDYPADGEDQLARTAAGLIGITKDDVRSNNVSDHEACGVLDPLDEGATSLRGRGKRVTVRGGSDRILADLIVGRELEDRPGFRFVRLPDQKRVYVTKMGVEISSVFQDWIEKDLLKVDRIDFDQVILKDYSIDERTYAVHQRDTITLNRGEADWVMDRLPSGREIDMSKMNDLLAALDELVIVGVRPKPEGLSQSLERVDEELRLSQSDLLSLQSRGYYFARDGSLLSNEGELQARTKGGITYTLRFGEIVYGSGEDVSAGTEASDDAQAGPGENRYLFITTSFNPLRFPEPAPPANRDFESKAETEWTDADRENKDLDEKHEEWVRNVEDGRNLTDELNARFAGWYYVIPADAYGKMRLSRNDLLQDKES